MVTDDEGILIARSREGDWDAFAALIRMHQRMIHSLTYRMSGSASDADDLAQETFIQAYRNLDSFRGSAKFSTWLYRIALNVSLRWRRRESRRVSTDSNWAAAACRGTEPDTSSERIQEALVQLPPKQRAAVVLTAFDGMTHSEAARLLGCPETTISWRLFAARRRLEKLLGDSQE
jgi:RNA polymerase sigma-70 factor, ECF subfamily